MTVTFDRRKSFVERLGVPPIVAIAAVLLVALAFHFLWRAGQASEGTATRLSVTAIVVFGTVLAVLAVAQRRLRERRRPQLDGRDRVVRVGGQAIPFDEMEVRVFRFREEVKPAVRKWLDIIAHFYSEKESVTRYEVYLRTRGGDRFSVNCFDTEAAANRLAADLRRELEAGTS